MEHGCELFLALANRRMAAVGIVIDSIDRNELVRHRQVPLAK